MYYINQILVVAVESGTINCIQKDVFEGI